MISAPVPRAVDPERRDDLGDLPDLRIVVIDPRDERRAITNLLIDRAPRLTVVGLAASLGEARPQISTGQADVVLVEIQMPVTDGLAAISTLREEFPRLRIVVSSFHDDMATRETARANGADGYLRKPLQLDALVALAEGPAS